MSDENLSFFGNWSSIIGLFITLLIAVIGYLINDRIKEMKRNIQFYTRLQSLIAQLKKSKSKYLKYLEDYENSHDGIRHEISQIEVILKDIKKKVKNDERKSLQKLLARINLMQSGHFINEKQRKKGFWISIQHLFIKSSEISEKDLYNFYNDISALQTELQNLFEDNTIQKLWTR